VGVQNMLTRLVQAADKVQGC